jgi:hypothetical protein
MADREFGGEVPVNLVTVIEAVTKKRDEERQALARMIMDPDTNLSDFEAFNAKVVEMQASVRSLNILYGYCDVNGMRMQEGKLPPQARSKMPPAAQMREKPLDEEIGQEVQAALEQELGDTVRRVYPKGVQR